MDKQQEAGAVASDSISTLGVTVKDYPPSEVYSSEPPPAYVRPRTSAVQIARIAAFTLVTVSVILGFFMLGSAYITATYSCAYTPQDYPTGQEPDDRPTFQHLVDPLDSEETRHLRQAHSQVLQEEPQRTQPEQQPPKVKQEDQVVQEVDNDAEEDNVALPQSSSETQEKPIQIRLPLQLDFDELANSLIEKNQRSRMNCVVEKKRAEEVMDHQPKVVRLPFGVNVTTDPRYEHITGERMAIFCESGNEQRQVPMEPQVTPVMVPVPIHHAVPVPVPVSHPMAQQQMPPQHRMMPPRFFNIHQLHMLQQQQRQMHQMHLQQMQMQQMQMQQMQPPQQRPQMMVPPPQMQPPQVRPPPPQMVQVRPQMMGPPPAAVIQQIEQLQRMQRMEPPQPQVVFTPQHVEVQPVQIIREEEHVVPIIQIEREEEESAAEEPSGDERPVVPADTVRPPPPQPPHNHYQRMPQAQQIQMQQLQQLQQQDQMESTRPHYVQPRSVRSVDSVLHRREKRVRRCACDCSC